MSDTNAVSTLTYVGKAFQNLADFLTFVGFAFVTNVNVNKAKKTVSFDIPKFAGKALTGGFIKATPERLKLVADYFGYLGNVHASNPTKFVNLDGSAVDPKETEKNWKRIQPTLKAVNEIMLTKGAKVQGVSLDVKYLFAEIIRQGASTETRSTAKVDKVDPDSF